MQCLLPRPLAGRDFVRPGLREGLEQTTGACQGGVFLGFANVNHRKVSEKSPAEIDTEVKRFRLWGINDLIKDGME